MLIFKARMCRSHSSDEKDLSNLALGFLLKWFTFLFILSILIDQDNPMTQINSECQVKNF